MFRGERVMRREELMMWRSLVCGGNAYTGFKFGVNQRKETCLAFECHRSLVLLYPSTLVSSIRR